MNSKPIIIVAGEPKSIFLEIFIKAIKNKKYKSPIILICSKKLVELEIKKKNVKIKINTIDKKNIFLEKKLNNHTINLIDVEYKKIKGINEIKISQQYIENCFKIAFMILKKKITHKFINGPISKKKFLNQKFLGITEYISKHFSVKNSAMLIYNKKLSVCPITTHLPVKLINNQINQKIIYDKVRLINDFYKKYFLFSPKIGITGLNPHCESIHSFNEDDKIVKPAVKKLSNLKIKISGPYSADTIFMKNNRKKFDVIVGMYHDQVLIPIKTLFEFDAINITLGLPFIRVSPDHGPNESMVGKNLSSPLSLIQAIKFLEKN